MKETTQDVREGMNKSNINQTKNFYSYTNMCICCKNN